jgi:uncharacterized membrane protein YhaH (DUF805 family)
MLLVKIVSVFFMVRGRITRSEWFARIVMAALFSAAFGELADSVSSQWGSGLFALLFLWSALALGAQRFHDIGRSGWALLIAVVPVLGPVWVLIQLLKRGVAHANRYGPDPTSRSDYLQVDIAG